MRTLIELLVDLIFKVIRGSLHGALILTVSLNLSACGPSGGHTAEYTAASAKLDGRPVGVLIGASLAEGHPGLHGLPHGQIENKPGQMSYYFEQSSELQVLNQGIGGQTTVEVLARWKRDVLSYSPVHVWVNCGQNDFRVYGLNAEMVVLRSLNEMIESAEDNNFKLSIMTLGRNERRPGQAERIKALNEKIKALASDRVEIIDYALWDETQAQTSDYADHIHPTRAGYERFMLWYLGGNR